MIAEIVVMDAGPSPKARKHIETCVGAGKCLCCEKPPLKRGLCHTCYYQWYSRRNRLGSERERSAYDAKLIRTGRLLGSQAVRTYKNKSVFDSAAAEVAK